MEYTIRIETRSEAEVSHMILGHNIEAALTTINGLLSDRLRNGKLTGPPHRMTGIASEWQGASCGRVAYELTPGAGLMGSEAQLIRVDRPAQGPHLHQNRIEVREGEELEIELWARAWRRPVELVVELLPQAARLDPYDSVVLTIDKPWYAGYSATLRAPRTDDRARLSLVVKGTGDLWLDQVHLRPKGEVHLCARLVDEMRAMRIPTLRFPGGIVSAAYNWRHGVGPVHLRPHMLEAAFHQDWYLNYDFGPDEYLELCHTQGITPALTVNVAGGTPEEAGEWAAHCAAWYRARRAEPPMIYWHIGNHPYVPTVAEMTPAMYVETLRRFVPEIKTGYPDCRIVAVMSRGDLRRSATDAPWREAILDAAGDLVDLIEVQTYGLSGARPDPPGEYNGGIAAPAEHVLHLRRTLRDIEGDLSAFIDALRNRRLDIRVGVAEWNWWMRASHWDGADFEEPPTVLHALFVAGMIHAFARLAPEFEAAHFYNLVNCMGILNHRGAGVEVTGVVDVFKLYRSALPGARVAALVNPSDTDVPHGRPWIDALCIESDGHVWLFIINFSADQPAKVTIPGFRAGGGIDCIGGSSPVGRIESPRTGSAPCETDGNRLTIPPMSIVRCQIGR